jgi:tryptophan-rich sensory protein
MSSRAEPLPRARRWVGLGISLAIAFAIAGIGGAATGPSIETWYAGIPKPWFTPPNWVFGPVWTILFVMMAVAAWRVWEARGWQGARVALALYGIKLVLNALWSVLFFGLHRPDWALVEVLVFAGAIAATLVAFWRIDRFAGWLMAPYLAWAVFAAVLNARIVQIN